MQAWVRKTLSAGVLAAGALLLVPGAANADQGQVNGTLTHAPVNACGESLALLGGASSAGACDASSRTEWAQGGWNQFTGILNAAPISIPINICGNSLGILGSARSGGGCSSVVYWIDAYGRRHYLHRPVFDSVHNCQCLGGDPVPGGAPGYRDPKPGYPGDQGSKPGKGHQPGSGQKPAKGQKPGNGTEPVSSGYGGQEPATDGYGGQAPDTNGYGGQAPDTNSYGGEAPDTNSNPKGNKPAHNGNEPVGNGYNTRGKTKGAETAS